MKTLTPSLAVAAVLSQSGIAMAEPIVERHHHLPPHMAQNEQGVKTADYHLQRQIKVSLQVNNSEVHNSSRTRHIVDSAIALPPQSSAAIHWQQEHQVLTQHNQSVQSAACQLTASALAAASGQARINLLKNHTDFKCLSKDLWASGKSLYASLFNQNAMIEIANQARQLALNYDGTNANQLQNFVLYLRVGFWAQWGNKDVIGEYTQALTDANHSFLDTFAANGNYYNTDEVHAQTAKEVMILMNNFSSARYLPQAIQIIQRYNKDRDYYMQSLMTQALTLLFRGASQTAFRTKVEADRSILRIMERFLLDNTDLIGHKNEYQFNDATNEMARFLSYGGETYKEAKPLVKQHLDRYSMTGNGATSWLKAAAMVDWADKSNCSYYGTCNFKTQLEASVLPITHNCSASLRVRAQQLTQGQLQQICQDLSAQEIYFHQKLETGNTPVADDNNTTLEMVIYNSSKDYKKYSGVLFGHSTNNGGMYLEGDPSKVGNIPRFLAYEAEWKLPAFEVWNLTHEYVHYLDGRFNLHGDFATGNAHDTVWWSEGLAEYISKQDQNDKAVNKAKDKTHLLSSLFRTNYNHDSSRIYDWGYLATRYMFEQQKSSVDDILSKVRVGDYTGYDGLLNAYGTGYDAGFYTWLESVGSSGGGGGGNPTTSTPLVNGESKTLSASAGQPQRFVIDIGAGATGLKIETSGGTGEGDLYVKVGSAPDTNNYDYRPWVAGNNEKVEVAQPQQGKWHIMLNPATDITNVTLKTSWQDNVQLSDACQSKSAVSYGAIASKDTQCVTANSASFYIWVPENSQQLTIRTQHGSGDVSVYHKAGSWPTQSDFQHSSATQGSNAEKIEISQPQKAWHHIVLKGQGAGTSLQVELK